MSRNNNFCWDLKESSDAVVQRTNFTVIAIVLSYNTKEKLRRSIPALFSQTYTLSEIAVVDNYSGDGTVEMIEIEFPRVTLLRNLSNLGVGMGYAKGLEYALKRGYDWVWLLDGDSFPEKTALEQLILSFEEIRDIYPKIGILASSPVNPLTEKRYPPLLWKSRLIKVSEKPILLGKPLLVDSVISSGSLIKREVIECVGLPREDFFIDFVDHEYNLRARRSGFQIVYIPSSIVYHEIGVTAIRRSVTRFGKEQGFSDHSPWRLYYIVRNELYTYLYEFKDWRTIFFFIIKIARTVASIFLHNYSEKKERILYIFMGIKDGLKGKLGKVVIPGE